MTEPIVQLIHLSKQFASLDEENQNTQAVNGVNMEIAEGEFFTLLGPSGCGKTTILRMIAGFEEPTSGEVRIAGQKMNNLPPYLRPVNTVFQNYALFPHLNVEQNVGFGLTVKRVNPIERRQRVADALQLVRLTGLERRKPSQLSGGQQQRVALARALVNRPKVLLLDEPLGALDLKLRKEMQFELKQLQAHLGITFIFVTHDQGEALTLSDRIAVMNEGRLLQVDVPQAIYENPASRFVAEFIGDSNFLDAEVLALQNGHVHLKVGADKIMINRNGASLVQGQHITLTVRPEKFDLVAINGRRPQDDDAELVLFGTVQEAIYAGTDTRYLIQLDHQESVLVTQRNVGSHHPREFRAGDRVQLECAAQDSRPLAG